MDEELKQWMMNVEARLQRIEKQLGIAPAGDRVIGTAHRSSASAKGDPFEAMDRAMGIQKPTPAPYKKPTGELVMHTMTPTEVRRLTAEKAAKARRAG